MNNFKTFTIDDFRDMVNHIVDEHSDPDGEIHQILAEGRHYVAEAAKFDVEFARKIGLVVSSIEDLVTYANNRKERS